jgi:hypothetical protein
MQVRLSSPADLPDIDGECIKIKYSLEEVQGSDHPVDIVLLHEMAELWREISFFEDIERFVEIAQILVEKYGNRLADIIVDENKIGAWLYGDKIDAPQLVNRVKKKISRKYNKNKRGN